MYGSFPASYDLFCLLTATTSTAAAQLSHQSRINAAEGFFLVSHGCLFEAPVISRAQLQLTTECGRQTHV